MNGHPTTTVPTIREQVPEHHTSTSMLWLTSAARAAEEKLCRWSCINGWPSHVVKDSDSANDFGPVQKA